MTIYIIFNGKSYFFKCSENEHHNFCEKLREGEEGRGEEQLMRGNEQTEGEGGPHKETLCDATPSHLIVRKRKWV